VIGCCGFVVHRVRPRSTSHQLLRAT
jgi:hypothetical protein